MLGINYAPEPVGIGPYTTEMAALFAASGHRIEVVTAKPYYPDWRIAPDYTQPGTMVSDEDGVRVLRVPIYVPRVPKGIRRILHHLSFALSALWPMLRAARRMRPDVVIAIAPSMISAPIARLAAWRYGAKTWLHIQDFEVGAAFATGLMKPGSPSARLALAFERFAYGKFDQYSSISTQMCAQLEKQGIASHRIVEFPNWADISAVHPLGGESPYREEWEIKQRYVALYSGNIAYKQGIDLVVEAARLLKHRDDLLFLICGEGPRRAALVEAAANLPNIRFGPLVPRERLGDLLGLASLHLLPQLAEAADAVLPSKLTNMLASGRPVITTAAPNTTLAIEVEGCGVAVSPGDASAFARAIEELLSQPAAMAAASQQARKRAEERWSKEAILKHMLVQVSELAGGERLGAT